MSEDPALAIFNGLPAEEASSRLKACLNAPGWVARIGAGRPYPDRRALFSAVRAAGAELTDADLASALSHHPRIGERATGDGREAAYSRGEQSSVDASDPALAELLAAGNLAYERRFDRVFLIRAAGRSGAEIMAALESRLGNDDATEAAIVRQQLAEIAELRLAGQLEELV